MTTSRTIALALAVAAAGSAAFAAEGAGSQAETSRTAPVVAAAKPKAKGDEVVCKASEETGTRLGSKRTCFTRDQWAQLNANSYSAVNHMQMQFLPPR